MLTSTVWFPISISFQSDSRDEVSDGKIWLWEYKIITDDSMNDSLNLTDDNPKICSCVETNK